MSSKWDESPGQAEGGSWASAQPAEAQAGRCSSSSSHTFDSISETLGNRLTDIEEALRHASDAHAMEKERVTQLEERLKTVEHDIHDDIDRLTKEVAEAKDLASAATRTNSAANPKIRSRAQDHFTKEEERVTQLEERLKSVEHDIHDDIDRITKEVAEAKDLASAATRTNSAANPKMLGHTVTQASSCTSTSEAVDTARERRELRPAAGRVSGDGRFEVKELATGR